MGNKDNNTPAVNAVKIAVQTVLDGIVQGLHQGTAAIDLMRLSVWPDKSFLDCIPVIDKKPSRFLPGGGEDPLFGQKLSAWQAKLDTAVQNYLAAMKAKHPTVQLALMGSSDGKTNWFLLTDAKYEKHYLSFVKSTILLKTKELAIRKMVKP